MDERLYAKKGTTSQSTPKPASQSVELDPVEELEVDAEQDPTAGPSLFTSVDESPQQRSSDDSGINVSSMEPVCEVQGGSSAYSCSLSTRVQEIEKKAQELIHKINSSRATDQDIIDNFQEKLIKKVKEVCQHMREQMFIRYEETGRVMEARLLELSEVLERSSQLNADLQNVSLTLAAINRGLRQAPQK